MKKKYNIMTVLNSDYFEFGKMFVNSFYDVVDIEAVNCLYIFDTGLNDLHKAYLEGFPKLKIVSTNLRTKHTALHDKDWCKNVYSKTQFLLDIVEQDKLPTIMIDSDCLFIKNFLEDVPANHDFIVCKRDDRDSFCEHIASYFVVNSIENASVFINEWREEMYYGTENHKESPALSRLVYKNKHDVGFIAEDIISYTGREITDTVYIAHMKSAPDLKTIYQRVHQSHLKVYCDKYLTDAPLIGAEEFLKKYPEGCKSVLEEKKEAGKEDVLKNLTPAQRALLVQRLKKERMLLAEEKACSTNIEQEVVMQ